MNDNENQAPARFSAAITQLHVTLATLENNAPIHRAEGNHAQADLCERNIPQFRKAIAILEAAQA
jgi:hypothetical protein